MVSCGGSPQQGSTAGLSSCQEGRFSENFGWNQALLWPRACSWLRTFHMSFCGLKKDKGKGSPKWKSVCVWRGEGTSGDSLGKPFPANLIRYGRSFEVLRT